MTNLEFPNVPQSSEKFYFLKGLYKVCALVGINCLTIVSIPFATIIYTLSFPYFYIRKIGGDPSLEEDFYFHKIYNFVNYFDRYNVEILDKRRISDMGKSYAFGAVLMTLIITVAVMIVCKMSLTDDEKLRIDLNQIELEQKRIELFEKQKLKEQDLYEKEHPFAVKFIDFTIDTFRYVKNKQ